MEHMIAEEEPKIIECGEEVEIPKDIDGEPGPRYKRGRGRSFFKNGARKGLCCQVPGCTRPLHNLREYYKRYKICAHHMELNFLIVEDQHIRFCQQCGRFQLLSEFDGDKRSCRRKLAQHNVRRRRQERDSPALSETFSSDETNDNKRMRSLVGEYAAGNPVLMQKQQQLQHILSILLNKNPQQQIPREPKSGPYPGFAMENRVQNHALAKGPQQVSQQTPGFNLSIPGKAFENNRISIQSERSAFRPFQRAMNQYHTAHTLSNRVDSQAFSRGIQHPGTAWNSMYSNIGHTIPTYEKAYDIKTGIMSRALASRGHFS